MMPIRPESGSSTLFSVICLLLPAYQKQVFLAIRGIVKTYVTSGTIWLLPVQFGNFRFNLVTSGTVWLIQAQFGYFRYKLVT
jgi:hypothetical protein